MLPSQYTNTGELIGKLYTNAVEGLFQILSALLICWDAVYFRTLSIVFCKAMAYCVTDGDGASYSVILR